MKRNEHFPRNTGSCLSKGPDKTTHLASLKPADKTIPLWFLGIMQHLQAANVVKAKVFRYSQNLLNWSGTLVWRPATIPNKKFCYSPSAVFIALVGPSNFLKQIQIKSNINGVRIPTGRRRTSWLFTSVVGELNSGPPWTNPANSQAGLELGLMTGFVLKTSTKRVRGA